MGVVGVVGKGTSLPNDEEMCGVKVGDNGMNAKGMARIRRAWVK